tara:strand:- start:2364 stop:2483 length:120 start_codon:yes stop_codon:yes gene_type:complete
MLIFLSFIDFIDFIDFTLNPEFCQDDKMSDLFWVRFVAG